MSRFNNIFNSTILPNGATILFLEIVVDVNLVFTDDRENIYVNLHPPLLALTWQ